MAKAVTNHGSGKWGLTVELAETISKNWFTSKEQRDLEYNKMKKAGKKVSKNTR